MRRSPRLPPQQLDRIAVRVFHDCRTQRTEQEAPAPAEAGDAVSHARAVLTGPERLAA